jgi:sporulation protein YlmC with PRC-barrel domain
MFWFFRNSNIAFPAPTLARNILGSKESLACFPMRALLFLNQYTQLYRAGWLSRKSYFGRSLFRPIRGDQAYGAPFSNQWNQAEQPVLYRLTMEDTMKSKYIAIALLSTALMTGVAYAQTSTATADKANSSATMHKEGQWRSSKLIGVDVYNEANEKIGDIEELILDKSGKVEHVVLGVGGFLGMGEHYVAVAFDKLKLVNEPVRSTTASTAPTGNAPATNVDSNARTAADGTAKTTTGAATSTTTRPVRTANEEWYPDHAVLNATKDQLKAMTQFKYN